MSSVWDAETDCLIVLSEGGIWLYDEAVIAREPRLALWRKGNSNPSTAVSIDRLASDKYLVSERAIAVSPDQETYLLQGYNALELHHLLYI